MELARNTSHWRSWQRLGAELMFCFGRSLSSLSAGGLCHDIVILSAHTRIDRLKGATRDTNNTCLRVQRSGDFRGSRISIISIPGSPPGARKHSFWLSRGTFNQYCSQNGTITFSWVYNHLCVCVSVCEHMPWPEV